MKCLYQDIKLSQVDAAYRVVLGNFNRLVESVSKSSEIEANGHVAYSNRTVETYLRNSPLQDMPAARVIVKKRLADLLIQVPRDSFLFVVIRRLIEPGVHSFHSMPWFERQIDEGLPDASSILRSAQFLPVLDLVGSIIGLLIYILPELPKIDLDASNVQQLLVKNVFVGMLMAFTTTL